MSNQELNKLKAILRAAKWKMIVGVIIFFSSITFSTILYLQSNTAGLNPEISLLIIPGVIISGYFGLKYCKIQREIDNLEVSNMQQKLT